MLTSVDSFALPRPVNWITGPGSFQPLSDHCDLSNFGFVQSFCSLGPSVQGYAEQERFQYWCNTLSYMRNIWSFECAWNAFRVAMAKAKAAPTAAEKQRIAENEALPARINMVQEATSMMTLLLSVVSNRGEMGTFYNVQSRSVNGAFADSLDLLLQYLNVSTLPASALPPSSFGGAARLIVPTVRTALAAGESFWLQAIHLSEPLYTNDVFLFYRPLGASTFTKATFSRIAAGRAVFQVELPPLSQSFEYYVGDTDGLVWPAGAPYQLQTVTVA